MAETIDAVDRALIRELQANARQSNVALAHKVGLTEGAVRRRIQNLLRSGVFRIVAVGDPSTLGLHTHAIIGMRVDLNRLEQITAELSEMRELSYVYETTGQFDVIVVGFFGSTEQLRLFLTQKLAHVKGVLRTDTFHVMRTMKRSFRWGEALDDETERSPLARRGTRSRRRVRAAAG